MPAFPGKICLLCASCTSLVLAMPAAAQDSTGEPPAAQIDGERASIEVLKEGMLQRRGDPEWTFVGMRPSQVFFPGDFDTFKTSQLRDFGGGPAFERIAAYPRDVQNVERWYLAQIPDLYEEVQRDDSETVKVLYLPGCDEPQKSEVAKILPGEAALSDDFTEQQWFRARVEAAMAQAGIERSDLEIDIAVSSPDDLRRLNRHLLAAAMEANDDGDDDYSLPQGPLVLKRYCGEPSAAVKFPGMVEPPPPPSPPPPQYV